MTISQIEINLMPLFIVAVLYCYSMGVCFFYSEHHVEQNHILQKFQEVYV